MKKILKKFDDYLVDFAYRLIQFLLAVLGIVLLVLLPISVIILIPVELMSKQWINALEYLGVGISSIYLARGILVLKDKLEGRSK
jgi:hypothetical protein